MKTKWTVRNVELEAIRALRQRQVETGLPLGQLLSQAIWAFCSEAPGEPFEAALIDEGQNTIWDDLAVGTKLLRQWRAKFGADQ